MMFTDAATSHEGVIVAIGSKVVHFPHFPALAAATGTTLASMFASNVIGAEASSFDDLVASMAARVAEGLADNQDWIADAGDRAFDIHVVGLSQRSARYEIYTCGYQPGGQPETIHAGHIVLQPYDDRVMEMLDRADIAPSTILELSLDDALSTMAKVMHVQREYAFERGDAIGGFQQLTVVSPGGIQTRLLNVWPDRVGQKMVR